MENLIEYSSFVAYSKVNPSASNDSLTCIPNKETCAALVRAEAKGLGIVPDDSPRFETAEAAMAYLEA